MSNAMHTRSAHQGFASARRVRVRAPSEHLRPQHTAPSQRHRMPGASPSPKVLATRRGPPRPVNLLTWAALRPNLGRTCRPCRATPSQALAVPCRACFRSLGAAARLPRRVRRRSRRRMGAITLRWHAGGTRGRLRGSRGQRQTDSAARHQAGRPGAASRIGRARGALGSATPGARGRWLLSSP